jgi:hypothetical protein
MERSNTLRIFPLLCHAARNSILRFPLTNLNYRDLGVKLRIDKIRGDSWLCGLLLVALQHLIG